MRRDNNQPPSPLLDESSITASPRGAALGDSNNKTERTAVGSDDSNANEMSVFIRDPSSANNAQPVHDKYV